MMSANEARSFLTINLVQWSSGLHTCLVPLHTKFKCCWNPQVLLVETANGQLKKLQLTVFLCVLQWSNTWTNFNLQTMLASQTTSMVETDQKFEISLVMPEDTLLLSASTAENKMEWFVNLQKYILLVLGIFWLLNLTERSIWIQWKL